MAYIPVINYEISEGAVNKGYERTIWLNTESRPVLLPIKTEEEFNAALELLEMAGVTYDSEIGKLIIPIT